MKSIVIIPARYNSSRLHGKMLLDQTGKPLIQHVHERAVCSDADLVVVATDDVRIKECVEGFGGVAVLTKDTHQTGTERIAEAAKMFPDYELIVNLQGDEPEVDPNSINTLINIQRTAQPFMSTLCCTFSSHNYSNCALPSSVKVVLGHKTEHTTYTVAPALYFSRSLIPYYRANDQDLRSGSTYFLHIGIYAYSAQSLHEFVLLSPGVLEKTESLEQLRVLEHGHKILCGIIDGGHVGIDTPDDYAEFVKRQTGYSNK